MTDRTEVDAAAELAVSPVMSTDEATDLVTVALPPGWTLNYHDPEHLFGQPRRSRGISVVHDASSFVTAVKQRWTYDESGEPRVVIYANEADRELVAVLNDDVGDEPGWRDYRVSLGLRVTPEWQHWKSRDGRLMAQADFAAHIEDGVNELVDPSPAAMLELAQTFHATTSAAFKSGTRLASGQVQFRYEETIDASAGGDGTVAIPEQIKLIISPFYGAPRYEVTARFRYRLTRGEFTLGYQLDRPHRMELAAFADVRKQVTDDLPEAISIAGMVPDLR